MRGAHHPTVVEEGAVSCEYFAGHEDAGASDYLTKHFDPASTQALLLGWSLEESFLRKITLYSWQLESSLFSVSLNK